ncbi:hypothetical protein FisN_29Hh098 [Fistulifera solaris]|uniref:Uncharacterized protein n=1 Tax=Fistulifera solaris TaxID=1519565 RepID=A0A1Z5K5X8_FISSO|nr:hypothetical protein FisN_29Hh098 [Fistulifera solaris]|eukprot:GAX21660.1 hypothetical protein FisN_29Hh098 [Fistulifera solaris]
MWRFILRHRPARQTRSFSQQLLVGRISSRIDYATPAFAGLVSCIIAWELYHRDESSVCEGRLLPHVPQLPTNPRKETLRLLQEMSDQAELSTRYQVDWDEGPLGVGAFGTVYWGVDKKSGEPVALKKIPKELTDEEAFLREMTALMQIQKAGGHPYICSLRDCYADDQHYYLIFDLVSGGEMFDHLVDQGSYSERDAARLVREVASALAFLHGLGTTHGDLKPENLMLSTKNPSDACIKLVDFGCALVEDEDNGKAVEEDENAVAAFTVAYCPPEILRAEDPTMSPAMDMWALGVILYIMLTGIHPFDLRGDSSDEEIEKTILSGKKPPLRNSSIAYHLSDSAIDIIEKLIEPDPSKRLTADEMLEHPWVNGTTASSDAMTGASKKLSMFRAYRTKMSAKVFANIVSWSDDEGADDVSKRVSLIERSFRAFDSKQRGYLTRESVEELLPDTEKPRKSSFSLFGKNDPAKLSLSGFSDLLAENMQNKYFPKNHIVYKEGSIGNHMYFINSGTVLIETESGSVVTRGAGDFFGEGALLNPKKTRSATIRCLTPVHAMEISREYFEKYLASSDADLLLTLKEKDMIRKRNRAKMILRLQKNLKEMQYRNGQTIFSPGDASDHLFIVEKGKVDILMDGSNVFSATPGNVFGEYAAITGRRRNCSAECSDKDGCKLLKMMGRDFRKLVQLSPELGSSLRDLSIRRDFKKAVVKRINKEFPYNAPLEAFNAIRSNICRDECLCQEAISVLMRELNPEFTDEEMEEVMRTLGLSNNESLSFDAFKKIFIADKQRSKAI